jgi:hypothetical protein
MTSVVTLEKNADLYDWFGAHLPCPSLETRLRADLESVGLLQVSVTLMDGKITRVSKHPELRAETRIQQYSKFTEISTLITSIELKET